jgi:hypothetical protein
MLEGPIDGVVALVDPCDHRCRLHEGRSRDLPGGARTHRRMIREGRADQAGRKRESEGGDDCAQDESWAQHACPHRVAQGTRAP